MRRQQEVAWLTCNSIFCAVTSKEGYNAQDYCYCSAPGDRFGELCNSDLPRGQTYEYLRYRTNDGTVKIISWQVSQVEAVRKP